MARQQDDWGLLAAPPARNRGTAAASHPARPRVAGPGVVDPLRAAPRVMGAPPGVGGQPPFLKQLTGPTALRSLPAPGAGVNTAAAFGPSLNTAAALGAAPSQQPPPMRALPPGTGQINLGMDADAGFKTVPRGAAGMPPETPAQPGSYEGVNWGPQNPKPGPNEMGATMGAYDRLNQARAATQQATAAQQPAAAMTAKEGVLAANLLRRGPAAIPAAIIGAAEPGLHAAAYEGQTPGWVQALEADAGKVARGVRNWAQRGMDPQGDLLAALPAQHAAILARDAAVPAGNPGEWTPQAIYNRAAAEAQQAAAGQAAPAKGGAKTGLEIPPYPGGKNFPARPPEDGAAAATAGGEAPPGPADEFAWVGGNPPQMTGARKSVAEAAIKPVMTDQEMADYRALMEQPPATGPGEKVGIQGSLGGKPFGLGVETAAGAVSDESKAGMQRVMEGLQSGRYGVTPEEAEKNRRADEEWVAELKRRNRDYHDETSLQAAILRAGEYRDPLMRAALTQAALNEFGHRKGMQTGEATDARAAAAQQQVAQTQAQGAVEQARVNAEGRVAEKKAEAGKPVTMRYKVAARRPGEDALDQEALYDPLGKQVIFDTGSLQAGEGGQHPFGAFEDRADEWDAMAKKKGYATGRDAYQAAVQGWISKYGQGTQ